MHKTIPFVKFAEQKYVPCRNVPRTNTEHNGIGAYDRIFLFLCVLVFRDFGEWNRNGLFLFRCSRWLVGNIKSPCAASLSKTSRTRTYTQRFIQFSRTPYPQAQLRNHSAFRQSHLSAIPQQIYFAIQTEPIQRGLR